MRGGWFNPMPSSWLNELSDYVPRFEALPGQISEALSGLSSLGVTAPMEPTCDVKTHLITQLVLFNTGSLRVAYDLTTAAELLFREGRITSTCLQLRLLFEYWGAVSFSSALGDRVRDAADLQDAETLKNVVVPISRLIGGSRFPVTLPRGGKTKTKSFSIMKFIQHLERCETGTEQLYDFLCEACHPSFIQQSYFWMAGSEGDNWTNDKFRAHAHTLLEKLTFAGESAALGLARATEYLTAVSRPFIRGSE